MKYALMEKFGIGWVIQYRVETIEEIQELIKNSVK